MTTSQSSLRFFKKITNKIQNDIWSELEDGLWREYLIDNQIDNNKTGSTCLSKWKPVFKDIIPIYSGTIWNIDEMKLEEDIFYPQIRKITKESFFSMCEDFFATYKDKHLAVHLSGGLDSSIIIGILKYLDIPFSLIGLTSDRFEFRTERKIQEMFSKHFTNTVLLDLDDYPFYSKLSQIPAHQVPDSHIKDNQGHIALAKISSDLGIDVVFTGQGGDTIFVDAIPDKPNAWSCNIGSEFLLPWHQDILYPSHNIKLVSFYADKNIIEALYNLRLGENSDVQKEWARQFFKNILPTELVDYTYSADFFGLSMDGLDNARSEIKELFNKAYELVGHPVFSQSATAKLLSTDFFNLDYKTYTDLCNRISIAVWYNSLVNGNIIKA